MNIFKNKASSLLRFNGAYMAAINIIPIQNIIFSTLPKSQSFRIPSLLISKFSGLISVDKQNNFTVNFKKAVLERMNGYFRLF